MLKGRDTVVLAEAAACKFFGSENPVGKNAGIEVEKGFETFVVSGVVKAPPLNPPSGLTWAVMAAVVNPVKSLRTE